METLTSHLVWDDERCDELAQDLYWTTVHFLESFNIDIDAFKIAQAVENAAIIALKVELEK